MSKVYVTSDLHLGHKNIYKYRDKFDSIEEHDDYIIDKILELRKQDVLLVLGDFLFDNPNFDNYIERLSKKKCRIKLVMGNHDSLKLLKEDIVEMQSPLYQKKNIWISHCPIHPGEMRNRLGNIHGHLHGELVTQRSTRFNNFNNRVQHKNIPDKRYYNVNLDVNDYQFVEFKKIEEYFHKGK
jgi:calcineurin-like phosphoesterase family protein